MDDQPNADQKLTPNPEHYAKLMEGVEAWNAWLQQDNPITPELRGADLSGCRLAEADLQDAHLEGAVLRRAHLEGAELEGAHLEGAILLGAHLEGAELGEAHLEGAHLKEADLEGATLLGAHLEGAHLEGAYLKGANLRDAHLEYADLTRADLTTAVLEGAWLMGATLRDVALEGTSFKGVRWRAADGREPQPVKFEGFDVRGIRYSDPLFDQFVRQSEFIRRCRETWRGWRRAVFILWWLTCDCGRNLPRWLLTCGGIIVLFGVLFATLPLVHIARDAPATCLTPFYFSVVTFSTLGFGDVTPCSWLGEIAVMAEVFLGYLALGGAISIFATKFIPPR